MGSIQLVAAGLVLFLPIAVFATHRYVQRLPEAPLCPECRAVTRELGGACALLSLLPWFAATSRASCTRCGWRGRMRWQWAAHSARWPHS